jgi:hypothetical protein
VDNITLICPACGKEITVPAELESFSCLYCGAKHRMAELLPAAAPTLPADEADRAFVEAHLLDCIRNYPDYYKQFNKKKYEVSFEAHREGIRETWEALDRYVCAQPARREDLMEEFVELFLTQWEELHRSNPKTKTKKARERQEFSDKLTLAWYTVPAIRGYGLSVSEDFPALLRERFNAKYPENIFGLGTYEEIKAGFRKHGFCFVTTAVCEAEGKADDCAELTAFRAFRDEWLARTEEGRALIAEYYETAPAVVAALRYGDDEAARCAQLRRDWLAPCYEALRRGDNETCKQLYTDMMQALRARYRM